ncbi:mitochondrial 37S ribosomal protein RSM24 [Sugiyamaella lignohabitans]|uniref:Mitochondrial 37S ribosomal protein RSM24 n=1 Tax=Sugiyamaella lignohabitans TaxID=796027 RepID=A0A167E8Z1_9ASCO|nr:mitochondrial 37S ribosomal protein RSM24 [Sugiyamaella lignohabitans]ANB13789.1 mitochondrial 37S ribosomal protein RSM24 [Sugiyamaella lignohabitans]
MKLTRVELASPYRPPSDESVLTFKYNTFLGEDHPAGKKVTVQFSPSELGLTAAQKHKLCLLAGARYNSDTDVVTISSSKFPQQAQNKRFLGDILKSLLEAARDESDTFADVPLETRHMVAKRRRNKPVRPRVEFPEAWNRPQDAPKPKDDIVSVIHRLPL